ILSALHSPSDDEHDDQSTETITAPAAELTFGEHLQDLLPYIDSQCEQFSPECKLRCESTRNSIYGEVEALEGNRLRNSRFSYDSQKFLNVANDFSSKNVTNGRNVVELLKVRRIMQREQSRGQIIKKAVRKIRRERKATVTLAVVLG
ncbi:unnamed protein product, partial [Gongylonema pulchrum]|uniref:MADF domain-containing protein n=1 Tax=Gongylonema pulchrum TaxID=637853 RepID=A0A183D370_9BILA